MPPRAATVGGVAALAGAAALGAATIAARGWPEVGPLQIFILVSFSLLVGLSTAASPWGLSMVGQMGPLVQVGRKKTALAFHVLGGATGGAMLGVLLGFLGVVLAEIFGSGLDRAFAIAVPLGLAYAGLTDLGFLRLSYLTRMRQTPGSWPCALGHYPAMFAWGFDLGLGVTTRFAHQAVLVVPLAAVLTGSLWAAVAISAAYGGGRALAVAYAIMRAGEEDFGAACDRIQNRTGLLKRLVGATALVTAVLIVIF